MISSILTPVRWYNTIHEQERFNIDCDICDFELISDKTRLLPFQFRRPKSGYFINKWFLRKVCEHVSVPLLNNNDSLFTLNSGYWNLINFDIINGKLKSTATTGQVEKASLFTPGKYYEIKIIMNENTVNYYANVSTNSGILFEINSTGTYTHRFLAGAGVTDFIIETSYAEADDYGVIESIQVYELKSFDDSIGDIDLDLNLINLVNVGTEDIISYCGNVFQFQIPCGKYYMVLTSSDNVIYYSEVITVKDFIPSQSPYVLLEWKNSCDLSDVKYEAINACAYLNRLYINGPLTHPEYPFKEEAEEDGNQNLNIVFQKWEKKQSLIAPKCPEFIVDSLTAIRLHDEIFITKPIRKKQIQVLDAIEIDKIEYDVQYILNDCAANVELKMLLKDKVVDSTCCTNITLTTCKECQYTVTGIDVLSGNYYFGNLYSEDFNLFEITTLITSTITGKDTGSPLIGFQYKITGDKTLDYPVGTTIYVDGTLSITNRGFKTISAISYDIGSNKTSIQWTGIETELGEGFSGTIKKISYLNITNDGTIVCVEGDESPYYNQNAEYWSQVPIITNITDIDMGGGLHKYIINGVVYDDTFVKITVSVYDADLETTTTIEYPNVYTAQDLYSGIYVTNETIGFEIPENSIISFTVNNYDLACNYGNSNTYDISYISSLFHPVFQTWYDSLEGDKPSLELAIDANAFIQGLDDDGLLNEFDLLHWIAGWETEEQRLTPIISSSGLDFVKIGTNTLDINGFTGNGVDGLLNLNWKPISHGVKYTQDHASFGIYISTDINGDMCDIGLDYTSKCYIFSDNGTGNFAGAINDGLHSVNANTGTIGLFSMLRESSASQRAIKNYVLLSPNLTTSIMPGDTDFIVGALNDGGIPDKFSTRQYQFVYIGSDLINSNDLYSRITTYKTARGI